MEAEASLKKRILLSPTKPSPKRVAVFGSPKKTSETSLGNLSATVANSVPNISSAEISTDGKPTAQTWTTEHDNRQQIQSPESPQPHGEICGRNGEFSVPLDFKTGTDIQQNELLLYCLLAVHFPQNSFKARYFEKYHCISSAINNVCHAHFSCKAIHNYLYRANKNLRKDLGKVKGRLRWRFYRKKIENIVDNNITTLKDLVSSREPSREAVNELRQQLKNECDSKPESNDEDMACETTDNTTLVEKLLESDEINDFPDWKFRVNSEDGTSHLYYFNEVSRGYCQVEVIINNEGCWSVLHEGRARYGVTLDWANISDQINSLMDLKKLLLTIQTTKICSGISIDNYETVLPKDNTMPVYYTRNGEAAAFLENNPSQFHKKTIRSTNCLLFMPSDETLCTDEICAACEHSKHYLRTLKSRLNCSAAQKEEKSKFTRFDYLSKDELLQYLRQKTTEMRQLQERVKRLEECRNKMIEVGTDTDSDFKTMFKQLNSALIRTGNQNLKCNWKECTDNTIWTDRDQLFLHVRSHVESSDQDIAPIDRIYKCHWESCNKTFTKKKLLETHLREHTGSTSDNFFTILLQDQAKALTLPKRQMRWHPLVIKWCLRIYAKSHSTYEDIRESGFLKLPSGRLLSDYKNFSSPRSGWQTTTLGAMREKFNKTKIGKRGQLGGLYFDEVKIKEGLVFDSATFELIGFTDLDNDESDLPSLVKEPDCKPENKLATHVLQFFFKSLFAKFDFPCAFFLTREITAQKLNRIFWQGVSMLHGFGFTVLLTCCDGASVNRAFMNMNGTNPTKSKCFNYFSGMPLFFISDPPHLIKKLRNNIYSSGFKAQNERFTRNLKKNDKFILWEHIYSVYTRDKKRRLYATGLRSSYVHLDNLSKMRVKPAVKTLSKSVREDMAKFEHNVTESTQEFIRMCETLWSIFNDSQPLYSTNDQRITSLTGVLNYFKTWKEEVEQKFNSRSEVAAHFITWQTMFDLEVRLLMVTN